MANGEPAFAVYRREPAGAYLAHAMLVPTIAQAGIARIIAFQDLGLFELFGLPSEHHAAGSAATSRSSMAVQPSAVSIPRSGLT